MFPIRIRNKRLHSELFETWNHFISIILFNIYLCKLMREYGTLSYSHEIQINMQNNGSESRFQIQVVEQYVFNLNNVLFDLIWRNKLIISNKAKNCIQKLYFQS